ncbi:MAG: PAS domain S-box protein [Clostridia bacterium]|nr:PAS domain S-box protein [Clostridia bacterium]
MKCRVKKRPRVRQGGAGRPAGSGGETAVLRNKIKELEEKLSEDRAALEDRERKLAAITDNMTEGLVLVDDSGTVILINSAAARMLGAAGEDVKGKDIVSICGDDSLGATVRSALAGCTSHDYIVVGGLKIQVIASPVIVEGAAQGAVMVLLDVTSRQASEDMRREFSANVSHELKTPITSISGYAEMIMTGMARRADVPKLSEKIYNEAQRLIELTEDIIKLSRLDEGTIRHPVAEVDLLAVARAAAERLEQKAKKFKVNVEVSGEDVLFMGDEQLVDEMITNLCDNSIKYNRTGGHVFVRTGKRGDAPCVTVTDDGIGIAPEHLGRVFERFYRVDKSRSKETGGTGLGLSIVKHSAAWHRATVEAESVPGKGTKISIVFDGKGGELI